MKILNERNSQVMLKVRRFDGMVINVVVGAHSSGESDQWKEILDKTPRYVLVTGLRTEPPPAPVPLAKGPAPLPSKPVTPRVAPVTPPEQKEPLPPPQEASPPKQPEKPVVQEAPVEKLTLADLDSMTRKGLLDLARKHGIKAGNRSTKALLDLVAAELDLL